MLCSAVALAGLSAYVIPPVKAQESGDLVYQVQQLLEEVRELRGLVESQQREIENLKRRQRDQYLDLDQRLQRIGQGSSGPAVTSGEPLVADDVPVEPQTEAQIRSPDRPAADQPEVREPIEDQTEITTLSMPDTEDARDLGTPSEAEQAAYDRAFRALRETRYADAAEHFAAFLDEFPDSAYAPNAQYWLAETYYVTRDFETALRYFDQLLSRYPGSSKEGDALLKIGFSHYELRQWSEARAALEQVRSEHAGTTLARLAEGRLRDMRLAGHY
ncbi:MAG: tol-pal system protein YbgF [Gammaproteobacteria bacterium]|jgi:tol-pal system protein YbgF|nr:tol-pal system protein YbgF [Gammaproteobacteria bacterium]